MTDDLETSADRREASRRSGDGLYDPHFASEAQEVFVPGCRVFTPEDGQEGWYVRRHATLSSTAVVGFDATAQTRDVSFHDLRNLYR